MPLPGKPPGRGFAACWSILAVLCQTAHLTAPFFCSDGIDLIVRVISLKNKITNLN
jgi:hypothetical protein